MRRAPARPVRACFVRSCCSVAVQEHDLRATPVECKHFPHTSHCTKIEKICWQITFAALMQPFQYDLRSSAAKDNSITHAAAAPSNLDAATTMRSAETELQNTIELRAMASEIAAPKRISTPKRQKDDFEALFKRNFKRKIISAKIEKICWQITFAAMMQPFQYDLRSSAAKDNSITHAAAAPSNLDAATTMRSAETELQNTIELRAMASEIAAPKTGSRRQSDKKTILKHFLKGNFKRKIISAKIEKICWQFTFAALMQPFQYDLRSSAAKDNSITHAAAAPSNLDAATTMRFAASRSKPAPIYGRGNIKWRQWSSHSNAICN